MVQHFPDNSSNNTLNLCCVKVVCATFANDEFHHAENDKSSNEPSLVDTSSSFENDPDLWSVDTVSNHDNINNDANLHTDVPLDHGDREFEQPVLHIPNHDVPLDFGDYEHEQPEFHIPEKLSPQRDDERQMIRFPTSTLPTISHTSADDGGLNLVVLQVTQNSVQVRFPGITGGNLMYVEERLYRMGTRGAGNSAAHHSSVHLDHAHIHTPWENAIILEGNKIYTLTALNPGTLYRLRWQAPDKQYPDIMVSTQGKHISK